MLRSVYLRFILVNVVVVILSVAGTAYLAGRMTTSEYVRFVQRGDTSRNERLVKFLADAYIQAGSWSNIQPAVERMSQINGERVAVADTTGKVIADSGQDLIGTTIATEQLAPFAQVSVQGVTVGYLVLNPMREPPPVRDAPPPIRPAPSPNSAFGGVINRLLLISAAVGAIVAILATLLITRRMLRPVVALTTAAHKMEGGDLSVRVTAESKDEIGQLAHAFNAMAGSLARDEQLRRNMINDVAHELRTPLTNLRGYLEAARDGMLQPDQKYIESLYEETMLLNRLTDDLRDVALAEAGQLRLVREQINLGELAGGALDAVRLRAEERGITLRLDVAPGLPMVDADRGRMMQVLRNLLSNALDFTPRGGGVTVTVKSPDRDVQVDVRDSGPGIAPDQLKLIFERFYRVDPSRTRSTGGAGLGLTIVKNLVEAHSGRVWVESTVGVGSTFSFSLPHAGDAPEHAADAA